MQNLITNPQSTHFLGVLWVLNTQLRLKKAVDSVLLWPVKVKAIHLQFAFLAQFPFGAISFIIGNYTLVSLWPLLAIFVLTFFDKPFL